MAFVATVTLRGCWSLDCARRKREGILQADLVSEEGQRPENGICPSLFNVVRIVAVSLRIAQHRKTRHTE